MGVWGQWRSSPFILLYCVELSGQLHALTARLLCWYYICQNFGRKLLTLNSTQKSFLSLLFSVCFHIRHSINDRNLFFFGQKYDPRQKCRPLTKQVFNYLVAISTSFVTCIYAAKLNTLLHRRLKAHLSVSFVCNHITLFLFMSATNPTVAYLVFTSHTDRIASV